MKSEMIPDESIVNEVLSVEDSEEPEIDFAEGKVLLWIEIILKLDFYFVLVLVSHIWINKQSRMH